MNLESVATTDLKLAAEAWRRNAETVTAHRNMAGPLRWLIPAPDMSIYDKVDDLIAEVERLRWKEYLRTIEPVA